MRLLSIFINPATGIVRGAWRLALFLVLISLPYQLLSLFAPSLPAEAASAPSFGPGIFISYLLLIAWVVAVSWFCMRLLDRLPLAALGCLLHRGCSRDLVAGLALGVAMTTAVVLLQSLGGGTRLGASAELPWSSAAGDIAASILVFGVAAAYEELIFRGYPLQTLMRSLPPFIPLLLFAMLFGLGHMANPNHTTLATINTALAGLWLGLAYLKTRSLWFPTGLHVGWNWALGAIYGMPVSGLRVPEQSIFSAADAGPVWLTGGDYGPEGGAAATLVLIAAMVVIWQARWLRVSEEVRAALADRDDGGRELAAEEQDQPQRG